MIELGTVEVRPHSPQEKRGSPSVPRGACHNSLRTGADQLGPQDHPIRASLILVLRRKLGAAPRTMLQSRTADSRLVVRHLTILENPRARRDP
jgi:hypothetical protein